MLHSCIFHSFWLWRASSLNSVCFCSAFLTLTLHVSSSLAHTSSPVTSFFNSPWLSFYPLSLPFFSFFPLSPGPLLSPSERLRIPKGADAIKMLILSVYREREKGG